jgi:hypothetical protein
MCFAVDNGEECVERKVIGEENRLYTTLMIVNGVNKKESLYWRVKIKN